MTDEELTLLHRYLDGAITPDELESLNELELAEGLRWSFLG